MEKKYILNFSLKNIFGRSHHPHKIKGFFEQVGGGVNNSGNSGFDNNLPKNRGFPYYCKSKSQGQWIFWSSTFARRIMSFYPILTLIPYFCSICYVFFKFIKIFDIVCLFSIFLAIWSYQLQNVIFAKNWKIKIAKNLGNRQTMAKFFTNSKSINKILKM